MKTKQALKNAKWIIACKIAQSIIQLLIGMISARYLGPSNYGLINYAASIVAFFMPVMKLGLNAILVHELLEDPEKEGEIMGTSVLMSVFTSMLCMLGVTGVAFATKFGETETIIVCVLYSTSIFFAALEMVQYWFQYKLLSKYSSLAMLGAYVIVSIYKIFLLVTGKNIYWFALSHSIEYGIIGIALIIIYFKKGKQFFSFSYVRAKKMLNKSKHYILSGLMVTIFQNTDHIMLTNISGKTENGYYTAAITCAGVVQFVYTAIIDSFRPLILSSKKENSAEFEKNTSRLYSIITYLSLAQSAVFTVLAGLIINILFGKNYTCAVPVLQILTWYCAFSYMGSIRNIWLLAEEKQKYLPLINLSGVLFNVALNAAMIPFFGAVGAATASLLTQIIINFVFGFIFKPLKENNRLLLRGLNPKFLIQESKLILNELKNKKR
ncbi:MAG: flippase [Ruminococcaceae bacterium]|nr:flippase [Oscillospiraceae bacterium]